MKLNLKIWRQENAKATGKMVDYQVDRTRHVFLGNVRYLERPID
jgi:succinate dehydrogenase/fumarate reductase-like Fe-S protein